MKEIEKTAIEEISKTQTQEELERVRLKYLGKKGIITEKLSGLSKLALPEKKMVGKELNIIKKNITDAIEKHSSEIKKNVLSDISKNVIDTTLPGKPFDFGKLHPLTQVMNEVKNIFVNLGFNIATGPEIETDYYNFTALNIPKDHPSRDMQDTFYIGEQGNNGTMKQELLLRTHTSPVQVRVMENQKPPIRIIAPGKVYRHEAVDASHSFVFHQVEGLAVDEDVTFADLKAVLEIFVKKMFGENIASRFRPSFFPFTEPSAEVDMQCLICKGKGCSVCSQTGWVELLGCGMVHPKVFEFVGYDTEKYTGYAFGIGIERVAMLKLGIDNMRLFYENDMDFLSQF
ncbi:MAG: phenylalanine--tRNA ligase subunit alpha [Elusimicrobia bacterium CG06_land_8_20_14_3_00_38_11]|nr:MAG: phenylalanine--tRNA ligase subunit alpha [Elusimicrobia bacterium CG06_land_8_20_14_3_00_38_11]